MFSTFATMCSRWTLLVIIAVGFALLPLNAPLAHGHAKTPPVRLKIPKIQVDAAVEQVALTPEGAMDAPKGPTTTGWYRLGPRPGETGSAVIDGHFGWENGAPAVFDNLHTLHTGDRLYVENTNGVTMAFTVRGFRTYTPTDEASSVFISNDGKAHLNLITCTGTWNRSQQSYSNRLVVFADKETWFAPDKLGVISAD